MSDFYRDLHNRLELYDKVKFINGLGKTDYKYDVVKVVFGNLVPANLKGTTSTTQAETEYGEVTHRLRVRKKSITNINKAMYFIYQGMQYKILFWQPDFKNDQFLEIMLQVKIE